MKNVLLIGTGPMAVDYAKVLKALSQDFTVIGRGVASAAIFEEKTGITPVTGGVGDCLLKNKPEGDTAAIIATGTESLMPTLLVLINAGVRKILIEKPAAISIGELLEHETQLSPFSESIFIAYNRRFYAAVAEVQKMIAEDGGLQSMNFEFTEWAHRIEPLEKAPGVKENWFFANSTHVVDLAFHIAGKPVEWAAFSKSGLLKWHEKTNFAGAGITEKGVLFSYASNWESAGRWWIELLTNSRRFYLKPMETILVQEKGSLEVRPHHFDDASDVNFKPGLYKQTEAFINGDVQKLLNLQSHIENSKSIYSKIIA